MFLEQTPYRLYRALYIYIFCILFLLLLLSLKSEVVLTEAVSCIMDVCGDETIYFGRSVSQVYIPVLGKPTCRCLDYKLV